MIYVLAPAVLALAAMWVHHRASQSWFARSAWRWFSGQPLDGRLRTNATWVKGSSDVLHPTGRAVWWHHQPRLVRAGIRTGATLALFAVGFGLAKYRTVTLATLASIAAAVAVLLGWRVYHLTRNLKHHWTYHRPAQRALTRELSVPPRRLAIERDRSRVEVGLPVEFTGSDREREAITRVVTTKLALEAPDSAWSLSGKNPIVVFTKSEPPPAQVTLANIRQDIQDAASHEIIMGLGKKNVPGVISVDNDSPHVGLSMGSGDGKSTVAKNMAAQLAYHGCLILILDYKLISHMWARGLPNVSYAGTPAEIEAAMVWLKGEVTRRNQVALAGADIEGRVHADVGPRIFVICEELNATQNRLKAWWNTEMDCKGRSPGSLALDEVMFLGRQVLVNVLQIGQRLSVKATGSGDARENLGVLVFADPTASAWKMLIGDRHALPPASGHKGRLQVVTRKTVREVQGAFMTGEEARALALAGTVAIPPAGMPCVPAVPALPSGEQIRHVTSDQGNFLGTVPELTPARPPGTVTAREAWQAGMFTSLDAARKAIQRYSPEPAGTIGAAYLYNISDLDKCRAGRRELP